MGTRPLKRILVIEDAADIQFLLKQLFELEGYDVLGALNGQEALDLLHSSSELPNLILLDLMMPVMDGYQFRRKQEVDPRLAHIPVVVITADGDAPAKMMKVGAKDYVKKPVEIDHLLDVVKRNCV